MIDYAFIGARLKEARIRKNMTQEQLAAMTDVGSTYISHIETGMTIPSTKLLVQMMNILNCDPAEVLCIWFRSSPGKTCCNSLNGVPTSLFCRMCLQNFTTRKLRFYPGSLSSVSSPASASLGTRRTALNDWGERSGKTRASQHIRYSCVGFPIASYSA